MHNTHNVQCTMYNAQWIMHNAQCRMHNAYFTMHNTQTIHGGLRPPASIIHNAWTITTKCPTHNSHCAIPNAHYCLARSDARNDAWRPLAARQTVLGAIHYGFPFRKINDILGTPLAHPMSLIFFWVFAFLQFIWISHNLRHPRHPFRAPRFLDFLLCFRMFTAFGAVQK